MGCRHTLLMRSVLLFFLMHTDMLVPLPDTNHSKSKLDFQAGERERGRGRLAHHSQWTLTV